MEQPRHDPTWLYVVAGIVGLLGSLVMFGPVVMLAVTFAAFGHCNRGDSTNLGGAAPHSPEAAQGISRSRAPSFYALSRIV
jgi:hypothetical protein